VLKTSKCRARLVSGRARIVSHYNPIVNAVFETLEERRLLSASSGDLLAANLTTAASEDFPRIGAEVVNHDDGLNIAYAPPTHLLQKTGGFLSDARSGDAVQIARDYLAAHSSDLNLSASDISNAIVTNRYTDSDGAKLTHVYMRQTYNGLAIVGAEMGVHVMPDGRILSISSSFIPGLNKPSSKPLADLSVAAVLNSAASALGLPTNELPRVREVSGQVTLDDWSLSLDPIPTSLKYYATSDGLKLGWDLVLRPPNHDGDWYNVGVDAASGQVVFSDNWTDHAQYNVYALPTEAPNDGARTIAVDPADALASPFGWQDTNGAAGAEFTVTQGNNVSAYTDVDANNVPDAGSQPDGTAALNFNFPLDLTQAPSAYRPAAVTNLFYWNNIIHDVHYRYGFTEAAGNFQVNNYGRGGNGGDAVLAEAQDGSGTNNANFGTPPDGFSGRMQMYTWASTSPNRDGDLDATIMIHEYGHGVSNRLTGGPSNASALDAVQSGGMGEGWGDWWALMLTQKPSDAYATDGFGVATYSRGQPTTGSGLRRFRYSYNMAINPLTIDAYGSSGTTSYGVSRSNEVHATGEIWCTVLWDMAVLLMNKYGYDSNLYTGYTAAAGPGHAGNKLALQLVMDALKLQPANPSVAQARDAILQADLALTGGQNQAEIWQAFARRGLGFSFNDGGSSNAVNVTQAFDLPPTDPAVFRQLSPVAGKQYPTSPTSMTFQFSEAMDPASFSLASDVNFVGPGGVNLNANLTGFSFSPDGFALTVNFTPSAAVGTYTMTLGPGILSSDNGHPMDQNLNGTSGEPADTFSGSFYFNTVYTDAFGYEARPWAFENINLVPGGPGVSSILANTDDDSSTIPLGSNTFTFYSTTYSSGIANAINVCDNGFVSFGVVSTAYSNTDMTSPSAPRFAALWDDWYTQIDANDQVLYRFDDLNGDAVSDRLVIEWNDVHSTGGGSGVTFQAILQLNTGAVPGTMIANYVDLQSDNSGVSNGASASVGIKDNGTPPTNKLLITQDDGNFAWLGDGKAIRVATDWTAPTVSSLNYAYTGVPPVVPMQFSENVGASLSLADLTVTNTTLGQVIPAANLSLVYNGGPGNAATLSFPGYPNGAPPDGNYTVSFNAAGVTDPAWNPLGGSTSFGFFVLAGDANRDHSVDTADFNTLAGNFGESGQTFADGDFNYDGSVDTSDFNLLAGNFGKTLAGDIATSVAAAAAKSGTTWFSEIPITSTSDRPHELLTGSSTADSLPA
jgi:extracellular elastinolytic metalloproteinase